MDEFELVMEHYRAGRNLFITGSAGTGKSHILRRLRDATGGDLVVTASTGVAAIQVGGTTVHSFSGIGLGTESADVICRRMYDPIKFRIKRCKVLAIDEISMISGNTLDLIYEVFQNVRDSAEPFGGVQMIVVGDFFQLPPVRKRGEHVPFAFESHAWDRARFTPIILRKFWRQTDPVFLDTLAKIRMGKEFDESIFANSAPHEHGMHLFARNDDADRLNMGKLHALPGPSLVYTAVDTGTDAVRRQLEKDCLAPTVLEIRPGAQVMLLKNKNVAEGLVNGALGEVVAADNTSVTVDFYDIYERVVFTQELVFTISEGNKELGTRKQIPLRLAWAISVHKSQGLTLEKVNIDLGGTFEYGQGYVAVSRAKTLEGMHVKNINQRLLMPDPRVVKFMEQMEKIYDGV